MQPLQVWGYAEQELVGRGGIQSQEMAAGREK